MTWLVAGTNNFVTVAVACFKLNLIKAEGRSPNDVAMTEDWLLLKQQLTSLHALRVTFNSVCCAYTHADVQCFMLVVAAYGKTETKGTVSNILVFDLGDMFGGV